MEKILKIFGCLAVFLMPQFGLAHSFGKLYNLPVPFWMYLYGGVLAMLISFLIIGYFFNKKSEGTAYSSFHIPKLNFFTQKRTLIILKFLSMFLFILTILTGLFGQNNSYSNFNMVFFWVIFTLGLTYLISIIGNVYASINPWKILTDWLVGKEAEPVFQYPLWLGYYPALVFYFLFIWVELIGESTPLKLSMVLIAYTIITDLGVVFWGRDAWYKYCDFFGVFFKLIGKISPFELRAGKIYFRPPFVALLKEKAEHFSLVIFVLFMLSSTAFDGFKETIVWVRTYFSYIDEFVRPILGNNSYATFQTIGLLLSPFVFLLIYLVLIYLAKIIAKSDSSLKELALQFAFSLIPIALVYNIAHYYTLLLTEGPSIIRLISDPLGLGWNLFNTGNYYSRVILGANFVWHSEVVLILLGHIVSVYLTHVVALNVFPSTKRAFLSQFPMLILMVAYTMIGLWILAQPITEGAL